MPEWNDEPKSPPEAEATGAADGVTRRVVLRDGTVLAVAVMAGGAFGGIDLAFAVEPGDYAYLTEAEIQSLRGLVDRFVPADDVAGGAEAGCAEAIDGLLGAFSKRPARIYAGAPFSDRGGAKVNNFEDFLPLDRYERKAWRLKIFGSRGRPELEFHGPVKGWRQTYREGIAALDTAAGGGSGSFGGLSPIEQDLILAGNDPAIAELVDISYPHTLQFMYGAPEYGGNKDLAAWEYSRYEGDVQPVGFTRQQIEEPDPVSAKQPTVKLPASTEAAMLALAPLARPDLVAQITGPGDPTLSGFRAQIAPILDHAGIELSDGR